MARTKIIERRMSATVNMGNHEFVRVEVGEIVELDEDDSASEERSRLQQRVTRSLEQQILDLRRSASARGDAPGHVALGDTATERTGRRQR